MTCCKFEHLALIFILKLALTKFSLLFEKQLKRKFSLYDFFAFQQNIRYMKDMHSCNQTGPPVVSV